MTYLSHAGQKKKKENLAGTQAANEMKCREYKKAGISRFFMP